MKTNTRTKIESTTKKRLEFAASELYDMLLPPETPPDATVRIFMEIPGGADWSNEDLEVDEDRHRLIVEIVTTKLEETES